MKYRWLVRLGYAGILLMFSGCMSFCMEPNFANMARAGFSPIKEDYYGYWINRPVVLTRPLRVYDIPECFVASEYVGFGVLDAYDQSRTAGIFQGRNSYDIPVGTEVFLLQFKVKNEICSRLSQPGYFIWMEVPPFEGVHCRVVYFMGDADKLDPLPWKSEIKPEEPFHPADIEKLFPGGKWGD